jgi:hypothetical protein
MGTQPLAGCISNLPGTVSQFSFITSTEDALQPVGRAILTGMIGRAGAPTVNMDGIPEMNTEVNSPSDRMLRSELSNGILTVSSPALQIKTPTNKVRNRFFTKTPPHKYRNNTYL